MRTIEQTIQAGVTPFAIAGRMLRVITADLPVTVRVYSASGQSEATSVQDGYWCKPAGGFTRIEFIATAPTNIKVVLSDGESGVDVVTIVNTVEVREVQGSTFTDAAPVTVGTSAVQLLAASPLRREVRILNNGADYIYVGGSGVTVTNGAVKVGPGQLWIETAGAAGEIYAISGTGGQNVRVQGVS